MNNRELMQSNPSTQVKIIDLNTLISYRLDRDEQRRENVIRGMKATFDLDQILDYLQRNPQELNNKKYLHECVVDGITYHFSPPIRIINPELVNDGDKKLLNNYLKQAQEDYQYRHTYFEYKINKCEINYFKREFILFTHDLHFVERRAREENQEKPAKDSLGHFAHSTSVPALDQPVEVRIKQNGARSYFAELTLFVPEVNAIRKKTLGKKITPIERSYATEESRMANKVGIKTSDPWVEELPSGKYAVLPIEKLGEKNLAEAYSVLTSEQRKVVAINTMIAIKELHEKGILHNDIKPHNFVVDLSTLRVKVIDLEQAEMIGKNNRVSAKKTGTVTYNAPEVLIACREFPLDHPCSRIPDIQFSKATDLFSLGITLFAILGGRLKMNNGIENQMNMQLNYQFNSRYVDDGINQTEWEKIIDLCSRLTGKIKPGSKITQSSIEKMRDSRASIDEILPELIVLFKTEYTVYQETLQKIDKITSHTKEVLNVMSKALADIDESYLNNLISNIEIGLKAIDSIPENKLIAKAGMYKLFFEKLNIKSLYPATTYTQAMEITHSIISNYKQTRSDYQNHLLYIANINSINNNKVNKKEYLTHIAANVFDTTVNASLDNIFKFNRNFMQTPDEAHVTNALIAISGYLLREKTKGWLNSKLKLTGCRRAKAYLLMLTDDKLGTQGKIAVILALLKDPHGGTELRQQVLSMLGLGINETIQHLEINYFNDILSDSNKRERFNQLLVEVSTKANNYHYKLTLNKINIENLDDSLRKLAEFEEVMTRDESYKFN